MAYFFFVKFIDDRKELKLYYWVSKLDRKLNLFRLWRERMFFFRMLRMVILFTPQILLYPMIPQFHIISKFDIFIKIQGLLKNLQLKYLMSGKHGLSYSFFSLYIETTYVLYKRNFLCLEKCDKHFEKKNIKWLIC